MTDYIIRSRKDLPKSEVEIEAEIPAAVVESFQDALIEERVRQAELPGFRKGHAPRGVVVRRYGERALFEEAAEMALREIVPRLFQNEGIAALGPPQVLLKRAAQGNPVAVAIRAAVLPRLALPDYLRIAREENAKLEEPPAVHEQEVDALIKDFERLLSKNAREGESFILTDETAARLCGCKNLDDMRAKARTELYERKAMHLRQKRRGALFERLLGATRGELPEILIEGELDRMEAAARAEIEQHGNTFDAYLAEMRKTRETLRAAWRKDAEKRALLQLLLNEIAARERLAPEREKVSQRVERMKKQFKDAPEDRLRIVAETALVNENVIAFLESKK